MNSFEKMAMRFLEILVVLKQSKRFVRWFGYRKIRQRQRTQTTQFSNS